MERIISFYPIYVRSVSFHHIILYIHTYINIYEIYEATYCI